MRKFFEKMNALIGEQESSIAIVMYGGIAILFFVLLKLFNCGYHLVDDWEFLFFNAMKLRGGETTLNIVKTVVQDDLSNRFTPIHYAVRTLYSLLVGNTSILPYSISKLAETILCMVFLHKIARKRGYAFVPTVMFVLVSMVGYQSCAWWKLGTHEIQSLLLFCLGFYFLLLYLERNRKWYAVLSSICLLLMCGYKESFLILMPFIMLYVVYNEMNQKRVTVKALFYTIKKRWGILFIYGVLFIVPIFLLLFVIGTNGYGSGNFGFVGSAEKSRVAWDYALENDLKWLKFFGILCGAILLTFYDKIKKYWKELLLAVCFILPQIVIYHASGITAHYMLPGMLGFAYVFVLLPSKPDILTGYRKRIYIGCIALLLLAHTRVTVREADYYRYRGNSVQAVLDTMLEVTKQSEGNSKILSCLHPNTEGDLTLFLWNTYFGYDNVYVWIEEDTNIVGCNLDIHRTMNFYDKEDSPEISDMDVVVMYNEEDRHWCYTPSFDMEDFDLFKCGTLTIGIRKNSDLSIEIPKVQGLRFDEYLRPTNEF